jgi:acyl carrier protein
MPETDRAPSQQAAIRRIVGELAPADSDGISAESRLVEDLGYHSLALLELAFALEEEFGLPPLDERRAQEIRTVRDVENLVAALAGSRDAG